MKPPKFHVGQAVVWNEKDWHVQASEPATHDLRRDTVYHIHSYYKRVVGGRRFVFLSEIGTGKGYYEGGFAPAELLPDEALAQLLEETLEPVTA